MGYLQIKAHCLKVHNKRKFLIFVGNNLTATSGLYIQGFSIVSLIETMFINETSVTDSTIFLSIFTKFSFLNVGFVVI